MDQIQVVSRAKKIEFQFKGKRYIYTFVVNEDHSMIATLTRNGALLYRSTVDSVIVYKDEAKEVLSSLNMSDAF